MMVQIVEIQRKQLFVDLIVFTIPNFNMILGMDFLERNETEIDCRCKKVWFSIEKRDQFEFDERHIGSMLINDINARKMLINGYINFIAHMVSKVDKSPSIDQMLVI